MEVLRLLSIFALVFMICVDTFGAAEGYGNTAVGKVQGGDELYVNVGGDIEVRDVSLLQSHLSVIDISTAGNKGYVLAPHAGTLSSIVCVNEASIAADVVLSAAINGVLVTNGAVTIQSSATDGPYAENIATPTALNTVAVYDVLSMSTAGGGAVTTNAHCSLFIAP